MQNFPHLGGNTRPSFNQTWHLYTSKSYNLNPQLIWIEGCRKKHWFINTIYTGCVQRFLLMATEHRVDTIIIIKKFNFIFKTQEKTVRMNDIQ